MGRSIRVAATLSVLFLLVLGARPAVSQPPNQRTTITVFDPNAHPVRRQHQRALEEVRRGRLGRRPRESARPRVLRACRSGDPEVHLREADRQERRFPHHRWQLGLPDGKITIYSGGKFSDFADEEGADLPRDRGNGRVPGRDRHDDGLLKIRSYATARAPHSRSACCSTEFALSGESPGEISRARIAAHPDGTMSPRRL